MGVLEIPLTVTYTMCERSVVPENGDYVWGLGVFKDGMVWPTLAEVNAHGTTIPYKLSLRVVNLIRAEVLRQHMLPLEKQWRWEW